MLIRITHQTNKVGKRFFVPLEVIIRLRNLQKNQLAARELIKKQRGPTLDQDRTFDCQTCSYYNPHMRKLGESIANHQPLPGISAPGCPYEQSNGHLKYPRAVVNPTDDNPDYPSQSCVVHHAEIEQLVKSGQLDRYQRLQP